MSHYIVHTDEDQSLYEFLGQTWYSLKPISHSVLEQPVVKVKGHNVLALLRQMAVKRKVKVEQCCRKERGSRRREENKMKKETGDGRTETQASN